MSWRRGPLSAVDISLALSGSLRGIADYVEIILNDEVIEAVERRRAAALGLGQLRAL